MGMSQPHHAVKVWDLPVRLFHWVLVALFAFIPGDQPEKAIASLATLLAKFSRK